MAGAGSSDFGFYVYEQCDDANAESSDGCSASCELELGYVCPAPGLACFAAVCGDGRQDYYLVQADGSSGVAGAGGMMGAAGMGAAGMGSAGEVFYVFESCDDGNPSSGDGCDAACNVEPGFYCDLPGSPCRMPGCGDGFIDFIGSMGTAGAASGSGGATGPGPMMGAAGAFSSGTFEQCDDGNTTPGDGCSASCTLE